MVKILCTNVFLLSFSLVWGSGIETHIVGGNDVYARYAPHQVSVRHRSSKASAYAHTCGGIVLDERTILTAAHCINKRFAEDFLVVAGTETRSGMDGVVTRVKQLVPHELYNASITDNDIALMFLDPPLPLTHEKIAAIELASAVPQAGAIATVYGWGLTTENGLGATQLQQVQVALVNTEQCQTAYAWRPITEAMLCAGADGKDACDGDSGGPLVVAAKLSGLVSWGLGCARSGYPGVYVNVSHFLDNKQLKQ